MTMVTVRLGDVGLTVFTVLPMASAPVALNAPVTAVLPFNGSIENLTFPRLPNPSVSSINPLALDRIQLAVREA